MTGISGRVSGRDWRKRARRWGGAGAGTAAGADVGKGAGFYLNATDKKWSKHYNMYDLVVKELPAVLKEADLGLVRLHRPSMCWVILISQDLSRISLMGHSMGGASLLPHFVW